jgi:uncharacterized protein YjbJ (UPF0337 family)
MPREIETRQTPGAGATGGEPHPQRSKVMAEKIEHLKGKIKEKAGWLTDDHELERDGKSDQVKSDVKENVDKAGDAVKRGIDGV